MSGREPLGEPIYEEEAGNGGTGTSVDMRKDGKLQNWVKTNPEKLVNGKNTVHVRTGNGLSQNGCGFRVL